MRPLARIPTFLLSPNDAAKLRLQNQVYMLIIPKKLVEKFDILSSELSFDLIYEKNRLSLLGPESTLRETKTLDVFSNE